MGPVFQDLLILMVVVWAHSNEIIEVLARGGIVSLYGAIL
jgi:hypothetical protein